MLTKRSLTTLICTLFALFRVFSGGTSEGDGNYTEAGMANFQSGGLLKVVATTNIIGDVVSNIGGDTIELTMLIEPGQDPHSFEPTPSTLASVENANVIFVNGFDLEESLLDDIDAVAKGPVIPVSDGIESISAAHTARANDPHVGFDPTNVLIWVDNIEKHLSIVDPSNEHDYHVRAEAYRERLKNLDQSIRRQVASLPAGVRKLVTDHHVFGYFADEYGFKIIGTILPGLSTSADASARSVADLVELLEDEGIFTLFVGSTASKSLENLADTIASELGEEVRIVKTLTGSLSIHGEAGDTYIGYMEYNIRQIMNGLRR